MRSERTGALLAIIAVLGLLTAAIPAMSQKKAARSQANPIVALDTTMGTLKVQLFPGKAPVTTRNFLEYVNSGFYNGTIIHRVDFVIGLGGYTEARTLKPGRAGIKNESKNGLKNFRGTLAMARYSDPDSATSQFFINLSDNAHLDPPKGGGFGYAVFGKVVEGMDVVDSIAKVKTENKSPFSNIPVRAVIVKSAKVVTQ